MFGRKKAVAPLESRIDDFWQWWMQSREEIASTIESGRAASLAKVIGQRVAAVHPQLDWELAPGTKATHSFVVTCNGNPATRAIAKRLNLRAPEGTNSFEVFDSRQPSQDGLPEHVELNGIQVKLAELEASISIDDDQALVEITFFHPLFESLGEAAYNVAFLALDWLLGEVNVERWIGGVEVTTTRPDDAISCDGIPEIVESLANRDEGPGWVLMSSETPDGSPAVASARRRLKPVEFPLFDQHVEVTVSCEMQPNGLPTDNGLSSLRVLEDRLVDAIGETGMLAAHATDNGVRRFHFYVDSETDAASRLASTARPQGTTVVNFDPAWDAIRTFRSN